MFRRMLSRGAAANDQNQNQIHNQNGTDAVETLTRRVLLRRAASVGVAALAVAAVGAGVGVKSAGASAGTAQALAPLNLRSGPGTGHAVVLVIPAGGAVAFQGGAQNGFSEVTYKGQYGWVSTQYLTSSGGGGQNPGNGGGLGSNGRTTATVNFRAEPSTGAKVLAVLPAGTAIFVNDQGANGFWSVSYNGQSGWIYADYIQRTGGNPAPAPGGPAYDPNAATTTAALNLRAEPSTKGKVLLVMPAGAKVSLKSGTANGWRQVSYKGTVGWASTDYLN